MKFERSVAFVSKPKSENARATFGFWVISGFGRNILPWDVMQDGQTVSLRTKMEIWTTHFSAYS